MTFRWAKSFYINGISLSIIMVYISSYSSLWIVDLFAKVVVFLIFILFCFSFFTYWRVDKHFLVFKEVFESHIIFWKDIKGICITDEIKIVNIVWGHKNNVNSISPLTKNFKLLIQLIVGYCKDNKDIVIDSKVLKLIRDK